MVCMKCKEEIPDESVFCMYCGKKQQKTDAPKPLKRANGTGSISKCMDKRRRRPWKVRLQGKVTGYYETRQDAINALEELRLSGVSASGAQATLEDVYIAWVSTYITDNTNIKTREEKELAWKRLATLSSRKMREIKTSDYQLMIDTAKNTKTGAPLSRSAKMCIKKLASQLCEQAMKDDIINKNYASLITMPDDDSIEKGIFTPEQIQRLWDVSLSSRPARIVLLLIYTGLRINELFDAKRESVDTARWCLIGGSKTAAGKDRYIPIAPKVRAIAQGFLDEGHEWFVSSPSGAHMDAKNFRPREFYPLLESLGIEYDKDGRRVITPHSCRHTFFNMLRQLGADKDLVKLVMGHTDKTDSVGLYGHATEEDRQKLLDIVSSL